MPDKLLLKPINDLLGEHFYIPYYQRGYRWTEQQVNDLLNDIDSFTSAIVADSANEKTFYCLQPIVIKECNEQFKKEKDLIGEWFEVVDGQQRLTTIFLLIHYANDQWNKKQISEPSILYETRSTSTQFLKKLIIEKETDSVTIDKTFIDFFYMSSAYETIHKWVKNHGDSFNTHDFQSKLRFESKVIWYQAEHSTNSVELFTRLNMGKIPLTNAELIKALFLSSSSFKNESHDDGIRMKMEISQVWDEMEQKLSNKDFWSFLTNASQRIFSTKIELLFDMIADKKDEIDSLYTFLYFLEESKDSSHSLWQMWLSIEKYYQTLCEWYKDKNLYHKIGYLITVGSNLKELIEKSLKTKKDTFEAYLDEEIRYSVNFDFEALSYENNSDYRKIEKLLLLFNVESIRINQSISEYYPFNFHKHINWSLEHIHAQNSEAMDKTKKEPWLFWLSYHASLIQVLLKDEIDAEKKNVFCELLNEIQLLDKDRITWDKFNALSNRIIQVFSEVSDDHTDDLHSISNLALLSQPDNTALNNSVFEVKRREIIRMDKEGRYIPLCTKRVFLKYYNDEISSQQTYFWGKEDRANYLKEIKKVLNSYLPSNNEIVI